MTITNGYCTLDDVKTALDIESSFTKHDARLELAVEAASRLIDTECRRRFYADGSATARVFTSDNPRLVYVDDISTTTGLVVKTDPGYDGTFDVTWTSSDYQLEPVNGVLDGLAWPYTAIRAIESVLFPCSTRALVQVTATWGWAAVPTAVKQACIIQTASVFKSPEAPFGVAGFADVGVYRLRSGLQPVAASLVAPYRREQVLIG